MSLKRLVSLMALMALSVMAIGAPAAQANHGAGANDDTMADAECVLTPGGVAGAAVGGNGVNHVGAPPLAPNPAADWANGFSYDLPSMLMDTDPGHFNFRGTATCEGRDVASEGPAPNGPSNAPGPQIIPPDTYEIIASGDFDNLICGTGTANGDAVIRGPLVGGMVPTPPDVQIFTEFSIKFNGGVGGGTTPPFTGKLVFVVDADETNDQPVGGQRPTSPDGTGNVQGEQWPGSEMGTDDGNGDDEYDRNGAHSYAVVDGNENHIDGGGGTGDVTITPNVLAEDAGNCVDQPVREFLVNGKFEGFLSGEGSTVSSLVGGDSDG